MTKKEIFSVLHIMSMVRPEEAEFFYKAIRELPEEGRMLELGTGLGHFVTFFSRCRPRWYIYTIDAFGMAGSLPVIYAKQGYQYDDRAVDKIQEYWDSLGVKNAIQIVGNFQKVPWELSLDALFIDGSHDYKSVKEDLDKFSPFLKSKGLLMLHDYHINGVQQLVNQELKTSDKWQVKTMPTSALAWKQ